VVVQAGAYAGHQFLADERGGRATAVHDSRLAVRLGPGCGERLKIRMARHVNRPTMTFPWGKTVSVHPRGKTAEKRCQFIRGMN
jgi:hypothetical protein